MKYLSEKPGEIYDREKIKTGKDYFAAIAERVEQIDTMANEYLNKFEFIPNEEICNRIFAVAKKIFIENKENFDAVPWWVGRIMYGWFPYANPPRSGSIFSSLAFSSASQDAHLRNLLEIAEGRETNELDFPTMAEQIPEPEDPPKNQNKKKKTMKN